MKAYHTPSYLVSLYEKFQCFQGKKNKQGAVMTTLGQEYPNVSFFFDFYGFYSEASGTITGGSVMDEVGLKQMP